MKIKELLSSPDKWTKGAVARTADGKETNVENPDAVCFCFLGYLILAYGRNSSIQLSLYPRLKNSIGAWNDAPERTFEEVKQLVEELDI